jgi:hypothetical protein
VEMDVGLRQDCGDRRFLSALEVFPGHAMINNGYLLFEGGAG